MGSDRDNSTNLDKMKGKISWLFFFFHGKQFSNFSNSIKYDDRAVKDLHLISEQSDYLHRFQIFDVFVVQFPQIQSPED